MFANGRLHMHGNICVHIACGGNQNIHAITPLLTINFVPSSHSSGVEQNQHPVRIARFNND
jgi:hypothetical protein